MQISCTQRDNPIRFFVASEREAVQWQLPMACISIAAAGHDHPELPHQLGPVLRVTLNDTDDEDQRAALGTIVEWIRGKEHEVQSVLVHCWLGVSRSRAVALALTEHFGTATEAEWLRTRSPLYNRRIYRDLLELLHE